MKPTPFHPRLQAYGVEEWTDVYGYAAPLILTGFDEEYSAVRERAGALDFSMLYEIEVSGPGSLDTVNRVVTRDLARVTLGRIAYGPIVNDDGKMVDDCTCLVSGPDRVRVFGGNPLDVEMLEKAGQGPEVRIEEIRERRAHLCLQGPRSREVLSRLTSEDVSGLAFPYYTFKEGVRVAGMPALLTRLGFTGELGYEIVVEAERALELWDAVFAAGRSHGIMAVGSAAILTLRTEVGFVMGEVEYDSTVSPFECGLGWAVDFDKPALPAREGLERDRDRARWRLASVVLEGAGDESSGAPLVHDGREVGLVTMAVVSPVLEGATLGLARLDPTLTTPGTELAARVEQREFPVRVVAHPVYDPERERVRS